MNQLQQVMMRACSDVEYRGRLVADPHRALCESGIEVPADTEVRVLENTDRKLIIVLPTAIGAEVVQTTRPLPSGPVTDVPSGLTLEWRESPVATASTLVVKGRIDGETAGALRRELERSFVDVDLDLSGVTFVSSAGIGSLIAAQQRLKGQDCGLRLLLVPDKICNVFEVSHVAELFEIHTLAEYVKFFPKGASTLFGGVGPMSPRDQLDQS